jgi:hypothetical protein
VRLCCAELSFSTEVQLNLKLGPLSLGSASFLPIQPAQHATRDMQHGPCNVEHARCSIGPCTTFHARRSVQHGPIVRCRYYTKTDGARQREALLRAFAHWRLLARDAKRRSQARALCTGSAQARTQAHARAHASMPLQRWLQPSLRGDVAGGEPIPGADVAGLGVVHGQRIMAGRDCSTRTGWYSRPLHGGLRPITHQRG